MAGEGEDALARTLDGRTRLDLGAVLSEAWERVPGSKTVLFGGFLVFYIVLLPVVFVLALLLGLLGLDVEAGVGSFVLQLLMAAAIYPFMAGIVMVSLRRVSGQPIEFAQLLRHYDRTIQLVVLNLLMSLGIGLGLLLFIVPGIYLGVAWMLAMPMVVDRDMGIFDALETSRRAVTKHWFSAAAFVLVSVAGIIVGTLTLGIAFIWVMPWLSLAYAILYRELVGAKSIPPGRDEPSAHASVEA